MPTLGVWGRPAQPPTPVECPRCKLVAPPAFDQKCLRCGSDLAASAQGPERRNNTMSDYYLGVESQRATEADQPDDDQTAALGGNDGGDNGDSDEWELDADGRPIRKKRKKEAMTPTSTPPSRPVSPSPVRTTTSST